MATSRVQGELHAAGFNVMVLALRGDDARSEVETAGKEYKPIAAFAIFVQPPAGPGAAAVAEIWISDRIHQRTVIQHMLLRSTHSDRGSEILAVRAVDLLKASLAELWLPRPAQPPTTSTAKAALAASPDASAPEAPGVVGDPEGGSPQEQGPSRARTPFGAGLGLEAGFGMLENFWTADPMLAPVAWVSYGLASGIGMRAGFSGLGPSLKETTGAGAATIEAQLATLEATKTWWATSPMVPFFSAGVGTLHVKVTGAAAPPYYVVGGDAWSFLAVAGAGLCVPLTPWLALVAEMRGLLAWPPIVVRIAGDPVYRLGEPSMLMSAGMMGVLQ
jgi:hypothetical protein